MKRIVKITVLSILLTYGFQTFSQKIGLKAGLNLANLTIKDDEEKYSENYKMRLGFNVGLMVKIGMNDNLALQPGLFVSQKGYKYNESDVKSNISLIYLDLPVTAKYMFDLGKASPYLEAGPYMSIGLKGKSKFEIDGESESVDIKFGKEEDLKLIDAGIRFGAGLEISSVQIGLFYDLGLANISHDNDGGYRVKNKVLGFTLGYWFGNAKKD